MLAVAQVCCRLYSPTVVARPLALIWMQIAWRIASTHP